MFAWYVQDDWRITPKLTINVGLRHELEFGETERYNRANAGFDSVTPNPTQAAAQAQLRAEPDPTDPRRTVQSDRRTTVRLRQQPADLQSGAAQFYAAARDLVPAEFEDGAARGAGIFFESFAADFVSITQNGYSQTTSMVPSVDNGLTFQATLQNNPFPDGILQPTGASGGLNTFLGRSISFFDPDNHHSYSARWSLNIQRELPLRTLIEVGLYRQSGQLTSAPSNAWDSLPIQYLSRQATRDNATINALAANVPNPFFGIPQFATTALATPTTQVSQLLLPFPQFTGVTSTDGSGFSWYHALSVRVEKRFSHGFTFQANYTWSKFMEAASRLNGVQSPLEHVISASDRPQQFSPNGIYELPFGKGKRFLGRAARVGRSRRRRMAGTGHLRRAERFSDGFRQHSVHRRHSRHPAAEIGKDHLPLLQYRRRIQHRFGAAARQQLPDVPVAVDRRAEPRLEPVGDVGDQGHPNP